MCSWTHLGLSLIPISPNSAQNWPSLHLPTSICTHLGGTGVAQGIRVWWNLYKFISWWTIFCLGGDFESNVNLYLCSSSFHIHTLEADVPAFLCIDKTERSSWQQSSQWAIRMNSLISSWWQQILAVFLQVSWTMESGLPSSSVQLRTLTLIQNSSDTAHNLKHIFSHFFHSPSFLSVHHNPILVLT